MTPFTLPVHGLRPPVLTATRSATCAPNAARPTGPASPSWACWRPCSTTTPSAGSSTTDRPDWSLFCAVETAFHPPLPVGNTPLARVDRLGEELGLAALWVKNDGLNPSGSLKDRASFLVAAEARRLGIGLIVAASTGNAASALAAVCASAGPEGPHLRAGEGPQGQAGADGPLRRQGGAGEGHLRRRLPPLAGVHREAGRPQPQHRLPSPHHRGQEDRGPGDLGPGGLPRCPTPSSSPWGTG